MLKPLWKSQTGFTLIETLLAFSLFSFCLLLLVSSVMVVNKGREQLLYNEDKIAEMQLQSIIAQGHSFQIIDNNLSFQYRMQAVSLEVYQDKLVKRPGFEIFLQAIDNGYFQQEGACIYFVYTRQETSDTITLGCE